MFRGPTHATHQSRPTQLLRFPFVAVPVHGVYGVHDQYSTCRGPASDVAAAFNPMCTRTVVRPWFNSDGLWESACSSSNEQCSSREIRSRLPDWDTSTTRTKCSREILDNLLPTVDCKNGSRLQCMFSRRLYCTWTRTRANADHSRKNTNP